MSQMLYVLFVLSGPKCDKIVYGLGPRLPCTRPEFLDVPKNWSGKEEIVFGAVRKQVSLAREQPTLAPETCIGVTKLRPLHYIYMAHTSFHGQIYSIFGIFCPVL